MWQLRGGGGRCRAERAESTYGFKLDRSSQEGSEKLHAGHVAGFMAKKQPPNAD